MRALELIGMKFEKLTVLKRVANNKHGSTMWLCECECGKIRVAIGGHLVQGRYQSCGCSHKLPDGEAAFNAFFGFKVRNAGNRNIVWDISRDEFKVLTSTECFYCGQDPSQVKKGNNGVDEEITIFEKSQNP